MEKERIKQLAQEFLETLAYYAPEEISTCAQFAAFLIEKGVVVDAENYKSVCERLKETLIPFGEWVIIDGDEFNQGQVVDYDVLNNEYKIDKNGQWTTYKAKQVSKLNTAMSHTREVRDQDIEDKITELSQKWLHGNAIVPEVLKDMADWYQSQLKAKP